MEIEQRSYSGKVFRPAPEVHLEADGSLGIIATPWGNRATARRAIEILCDFVLSAKDDMEATSPFQKLTCLSSLANHVRVGMMLANDTIYREENKSEYQGALEICMFARNEFEVAIAQVGQPHVLLSRAEVPILPLGIEPDLVQEWSQPPQLLHPLPSNVIGLHTTSNFMVRSFRPQADDKLVFVSRSFLPSVIFKTPKNFRTLEGFSAILARENPDVPFWLGVHELKAAHSGRVEGVPA